MQLFLVQPFGEPAIPLRLSASEPGLTRAPETRRCQTWYLDTGYAGEAFPWRDSLSALGLVPQRSEKFPSDWHYATATGTRTKVEICEAMLWLEGNQPEFLAEPFPLYLSRGIRFRDEPDPPERKPPRRLLGLAPLVRRGVGLKLEIDFGAREFRLWVPPIANWPNRQS